MSSFVYFKFKSEKEPTRVAIDGPHTDVWNLKREIINKKHLGDGSDFDLKIYKENSNEEYTDDTEIIPKDSTVLARRLPAAVPGKGRAARYVSGKPPASAKPATAAATSKIAAAMDSAMTEEDKLKAMMKMTEAQWQQKQEEMSHDTRINIAGQRNFAKKANIPEGEPPHGYVCFRCGQKGHWIQACPTNEDASYDGKPRIKKTTGIPRSMLQKVDKSDIENLDEQQRQNVMITSEGEYVLAQADTKTWQKFQDQKHASDAAKKTESPESKELQEWGLECPIDKRMFVDPMKTPCCGKTYCHECIENALLDNDLECPNCHTENVSLEGLEPDDAVKDKIKEYSCQKKGGGPAAENAPSPEARAEPHESRPTSRDGDKSPKSPSSIAGRKRTASEATETKDRLEAPATAMKRQKSSGGSNAETPKADSESEDKQPAAHAAVNPEFTAMMQQMSQMPSMNPMSQMNQMNMPGGMPFMPMMMNPMMMGMMANMNNATGMQGLPDFNTFMQSNPGWNTNTPGPAWGNQGQNWNNTQHGSHGPGGWNSNRGGFRGGKKFTHYQKNHSPAPQPPAPPPGLENAPKGPKAMSGGGPPPGVPTGPAAGTKFSNQQRHQGNEEDNAYMRQPVNPQRAMNRDRGRRGMRTAEYKELGS